VSVETASLSKNAQRSGGSQPSGIPSALLTEISFPSLLLAFPFWGNKHPYCLERPIDSSEERKMMERKCAECEELFHWRKTVLVRLLDGQDVFVCFDCNNYLDTHGLIRDYPKIISERVERLRGFVK